MSNASSPGKAIPDGRRYLRTPQPLVFPVAAEKMPETGEHALACADLFTLVRAFVGPRGAVGSDQFVYFDPSDPSACLAPDLIVRIGASPELFPSWKTWERGAPHVGVEITSAFDASQLEWERKLERYTRAGIAEVVRFDPANQEQPLRLWDLFDGDLVERSLEGDGARLSDALGAHWCVRPHRELGQRLGLSLDASDQRPVLTSEEQALARIAELEAELSKHR